MVKTLGFLFDMLGIKPRLLLMLGKSCNTEPHLQPKTLEFVVSRIGSCGRVLSRETTFVEDHTGCHEQSRWLEKREVGRRPLEQLAQEVIVAQRGGSCGPVRCQGMSG